MKLNFRQKYGKVSGPGCWRSQVRLAPKAAGRLRKLANGGKKSGVIAIAVEVLFSIVLGTPAECEECAGTLAGLLTLDHGAPHHLRALAQGTRWLGDALEREAIEMTEAMMETESF